jgi:hypothetical protein
VLPEVPVLLPAALYIILEITQAGPVEFNVEFRNGKKLATMRGRLEASEVSTEKSTTAVSFVSLPVSIEQAGPISLYFQQKNQDWEVIRTLNVQVSNQPPPPKPIPRQMFSIEPQQQPSQSPDDDPG